MAYPKITTDLPHPQDKIFNTHGHAYSTQWARRCLIHPLHSHIVVKALRWAKMATHTKLLPPYHPYPPAKIGITKGTPLIGPHLYPSGRKWSKPFSYQCDLWHNWGTSLRVLQLWGSIEMHYANTCIKVALKYNYTITYTTWFKSERNVPNWRSSCELKDGSRNWKLLLLLLEEHKWTQRWLPQHGLLLWHALIGDSSIPHWVWFLVL